MHTTRREIITQASKLGLASLILPKFLQAKGPDNLDNMPISELFPMGVASGDVRPDKAILWSYYEGFYGLKLCVWAFDEEAVWLDITRQDGGFIQLDFTGLSAYKKYYYAFFESDFGGALISRSPIGSFKTAPTEDQLIPIRFGAVSCVNYKYEPTILEQASREDNLDFFILNGDNSYNDGSVKLHEYRRCWRRTLIKKGYLDLRRSTSIISAIDDHEIEDNFDAEKIGRAKFAAGMQAYFEHIPMQRDTQNPHKTWRKLSWGKTLDIFSLDCRTERKPSEEEYISPEQMHWLKNSLLESKSMFKVIINSVPISEFTLLPMAYDRWEGFSKQRTEILSHIDDHHINNLLWVSGDFHFASYGRVSKYGPGSSQMEVLAGPGAQRPNIAGAFLAQSSQRDWIHAENSYVTVDCDIYKQKLLVEPHFDKTYRSLEKPLFEESAEEMFV